MENKKKKSFLVIVILALVVFNFSKCFEIEKIYAYNNSNSADFKLPEKYCTCEPGRILKLKSPYQKGLDVKELQERLKQIGFYSSQPSGFFDEETEKSVLRFQNHSKINSDGIVGGQTWAKLVSATDKPVLNSQLASPKGEVRILIDLNQRILTIYDNKQPFKQFPIAVGKPETPSPVGDWKIRWKAKNWGTGFGTRWMGLNVPWGIYGIHGTNKPGSIGSAASHGCIRMFNRDVEQIYEWTSVGTAVKIIGDPFDYPSYVRNVLKNGSRGSDVAIMQLTLKRLGYYQGRVDGIFGYGLEKALKIYQKEHGLPVTGTANWKIYNSLHLFTD